MTHTPAKSAPAERYRLRTFGTLALAGPTDDTLLGKHGHQRHRLALLAVLAAAGDEGRSRDQLLLLFWPDAIQTRARHSLEQLLYAIRSSIDEDVFAGVNPVRLNPEVIGSDVGQFYAALERGELEKAVEAYRGRFLDGFYLGDAPEFEQWLDAERSRLQRSYSAALERLAQNAEGARDYSTAIRWWRQLAETDPVSSKNAAGLIRALVNAGDHAAALQYAAQYEKVVEQELDTRVGPEIANLVAGVRDGATTGRTRATKPPTPVSSERTQTGREETGSLDRIVSTHARRRATTYVLATMVILVVIGMAEWRRIALPDSTLRASPAGHGSTRNVAAYEFYRRGSDLALFRTDSGSRVALESFRQAIALDPNYAAAYAGFAKAQARIAFGDDPELSRPARLALAERAALRAVALDDSSGEAHAVLGRVRRDNYDMASAETELKRAVALEPNNAHFHEFLVQLYVLTDRAPEALVEGRRAMELDPLSPTASAELAHALLANHRCNEALALLEKLRSLQPPLNRAAAIAAMCYGRKQMWPQAIAELQHTSATGGPRAQAMLGYVLGRAGRTDDARRVLAAVLDRSRRINGAAFDVALVYFGLGEKDQGFVWLNKAVDDRSVGFEWLPTVVDDLRGDPRFDKVGKRLGLEEQ